MEDSPNFLEVNSIFYFKWKTTSNIVGNGRLPQLFLKMEDDLKYFENGRRPHIFLKMEDDLKYFRIEDHL